jgi:cell division protein YceG involved in septum cleavage
MLKQLNAILNRFLLRFVASFMVLAFDRIGGPNYLAIHCEHQDRRFIVTIQLEDGRSADEIVDELRAEVTRLTVDILKLIEAGEFAASVLKAQGLYDLSEQMAHQKLTATVTAARGGNS